MDEKVTNEIKENFDSLPESIKELILSPQYENSLIEISKKYQLTTEQSGILEQEATLVLMGLTPIKDFDNELQKELKIDNVKSYNISADISTEIFAGVMTLLKLMYTPEGEAPLVEEDQNDEEVVGLKSPFVINNVKVAEKPVTKKIEPPQNIPTKPKIEEPVLVTEKLDDSLMKLPLDVQNAILKSNYKNSLYTISKNHNLNVSKMWVLEKAVIDTMLGKLSPDGFGKYIQKNIQLTPEENTSLINEVNDKIFKVIREGMMDNSKTSAPTNNPRKVIEDSDILMQAGIEITKPEEKISEPISKMEERDELLSKVEHPDQIERSIPQKVTPQEIKSTPTGQTQTTQPKPVVPDLSNTADPYRMPIE